MFNWGIEYVNEHGTITPPETCSTNIFDKENVDVKAIAIKILTFPMFIVLLASLVSVGLQLKFKLPRKDIKPFATARSVINHLIIIVTIKLKLLYHFKS